MHSRALSLALALLLLVTQQFGLQHRLSHALRAPADRGIAAAAVDPAYTAQTEGEPSADSPCQICIALAATVLASLPALLGWRITRQPGSTPVRSTRPAPAARHGAPYLARAPPTLLALT